MPPGLVKPFSRLRRRRVLVLAGILLALVAVAVWLCSPKKGDFDVAQFDQIRVGMTQPEVEDILGCPAGNYRRAAKVGSRVDSPSPEGMRVKTWMNDRIRIDLGFDSDGRVISKRCSPVSSQSEEFGPRRFIRNALQKIGW
jgi:hypothetical protein